MKNYTLMRLYREAYKLIDKHQSRDNNKRLRVTFEIEERPDTSRDLTVTITYGQSKTDNITARGSDPLFALVIFEAELRMLKDELYLKQVSVRFHHDAPKLDP